MGGRKFNQTSRLNYYENKKGLNEKEKIIRRNRRLLKKVMLKAGFKPNLDGWCHWGYDK